MSDQIKRLLASDEHGMKVMNVALEELSHRFPQHYTELCEAYTDTVDTVRYGDARSSEGYWDDVQRLESVVFSDGTRIYLDGDAWLVDSWYVEEEEE